MCHQPERLQKRHEVSDRRNDFVLIGFSVWKCGRLITSEMACNQALRTGDLSFVWGCLGAKPLQMSQNIIWNAPCVEKNENSFIDQHPNPQEAGKHYRI